MTTENQQSSPEDGSMKVLYINNSSFLAKGGGGEERAGKITERLAAKGHDVTVLMGKTAPDLPKQTRDQGRRLRHVTCIPDFVFKHDTLGYFLSRYLFAFASLPVLLRLLWREEFDVVVETMTPHPTFAVLAAKLLGVPIAATRHEFFDRSCYDVYDPLTATIQLIVQNFLRIFEYKALVVPAEHTKQQFVEYGVPEERVSVIPNGVEYTRYDQPEVDSLENRLVVLGRLTKRKRQARLIRAVHHLQEKGYKVHLDIAGDGPVRDRLETLTHELGLEDHITFHGFVDEERKIELLNRGEIFSFASAQEGFGMVLLEAMAAGLPIVAKHLPVYEDFFQKEESGSLITEGDPRTFANEIQRLLDNPDMRDEMSELNVDVAARYSWGAVADQTEEVLEQCCEEQSSYEIPLQ